MSTDKQAKEPAMDLTREGIGKEARKIAAPYDSTPRLYGQILILAEYVRDAADAAARAEEKERGIAEGVVRGLEQAAERLDRLADTSANAGTYSLAARAIRSLPGARR